VTLWTCAACSLERSAEDGHFRCDDQRGCPAGRSCSPEGFCELMPPDAAPADAGPAGAACGTMGLLRDDFESIALDEQVWLRYFGGYAEVDGGRLVFRPPNMDGANTIASLWLYQWRDSSLSARVMPAAAGTVPATSAGLFVNAHDGNAQFKHETGADDLLMQITDADSNVVFEESVAYAPDEQAYWRLRHQGDRIHWDTSPDGAGWTEQASADFEERGRPARAFQRMGMTASEQDGVAAEVAFDDVNLGAPEVSGFCAVDTLTEDFDGDELDVFDWELEPCAELVDGRLHFEDVDPGCRIETRLAYDLTDGEVAIEVTDPGPGDPALGLDIIYSFRERLRILMKGGGDADPTITLQRLTDDVADDLDSFAFDPAAHRFWGFRHERGAPDRLYIRFSPDGVDWTESEISPSPDVSTMRLEINVWKEETGTGAGPVELDNLNLPPE
jgi:hypothetical protein